MLGLLLEVAIGVAVLGWSGGGQAAPPVAPPLHPIAGSFTPDGTKLGECSTSGCFEQALGNVAFYQGAEAALDLVDSVYRDGASAACHRAVHVIGAASLARNGGSVAQTFAEGSPKCWSGYYHGVLERSLIDVDSYEPDALAAVARTLCTEAKTMVPWIAYQCLHGLGHGLMITTGLDLPRSLAVCRRLDVWWDRDACRGGVFMENISASYGFRSRWLRDDDPVYPCNGVARADKWRCYQMVTTRILPAVGDDWRRAAEACAGVEADFVNVCFLSLGRDASSRSARDADAVIRTCSVARPFGGEGACIAAAAMDMTANDMSPRKARVLCESVPVGLQVDCYFGTGVTMGRFTSSEMARERDCRALTAEPRLVDACLRGGRSTLPRS